jgi:hypothetical protein
MKTKKTEEQPAEPTKIVVTVKDRLVLPTIFPQKSNIVGQVIARDLAKKFEVGKEEAEKIGLKMVQGTFKWDGDKAKKLEIELTAPEVAFLKDQIQRIDKDNEVTADTVGLCEAIQAINVRS